MQPAAAGIRSNFGLRAKKKQVYLMLRVGAGSRSFKGVEAVLQGSEKPSLHNAEEFPSNVPMSIRKF